MAVIGEMKYLTIGNSTYEIPGTQVSFTPNLIYGTEIGTINIDSNSTILYAPTPNPGTVTSVRVQATNPVQSSTSTVQDSTLNTTISLANSYGDTQNPYGSKTKNYVLAAPSNANGAPSFRKLVAADIPDLSSLYLTSYTESDPTVPSWAKASNKPSYTASEVGAVASSAVGAASGVAPLNASSKIDATYLPSYVDDVLEYDSTSYFPNVGEAGKIYVAANTNKTYRWTGTTYVEISAGSTITISRSLTSGEKSATINIDGTAYDIYSVENTDTAVTQTATAATVDATYELLLSGTADNTTRTEGARKTSSLTYNPKTKALNTDGTINGYTLNTASAKAVDNSISNTSSINLPTSAAVVNYVTDYVSNQGFITSHQTYTSFTGQPTGNSTPDFGDSVTISQISQSTTGQVSGTNRTITIPSTIANNNTIGLVKPWYSHTVASTGPTAGSNATAVSVNTISTTAGKYYAIESDINGRLFVNVPWTNVNSDYLTTITNSQVIGALGYTPYNGATNPNGYITIEEVPEGKTYAAGTGLTLNGSTFNHSNSITEQITQAVYPISFDEEGHITGYGDAVTSLPASDVSSWAKAATKPSYTASEVGALSSNTTYVSTITTSAGAHTTISNKSGSVSFNIPTKTSDLTNDSGFLTSHQTAVTSLTTTTGAHTTKTSATGAVSIAIPTKTSDLTNDSGFITSYTDTKVKQTPMNGASNNRNILLSYSYHPSDDTTVDTNEVYTATYMVYNDYGPTLTLTNRTDSTRKVTLSSYGLNIYTNTYAAQLKAVTQTAHHVIELPDKSGTIALTTEIPTKVSDLTNDLGFVTDFETGYLKLTGGQVTGPVTFGDSVSINDLSTGQLIVTGKANFVNGASGINISTIEGILQTTVVLTTSWSSNQQTVTVSGITAEHTVIVAPNPVSLVEYKNNGIYCSAQGENSLTFTCGTVPSGALTVNILAFNL